MFYCTFICLNLNVIGIERTLLHRRANLYASAATPFCLVVVVILLFGHTSTAFLQLLLRQIERNHITPHAYALLKT